MRPLLSSLSLLSVLTAGGCFTAELDAALVGVYACSDAPDGACPDGLQCINGRCESADASPTVKVNSPEDIEDIGLGEIAAGQRREIEVILQGSLELTPKGGDHVFGQGYYEVSIDDETPIEIDEGPDSGLLRQTLSFDNTVGAHRVNVRAVRNDGIPYDVEGATASRLFFVGDGVTPLLGLKRPLPGQTFPLEDAQASVEAAVINFALRPADPLGEVAVGVGHVHLYYDKVIETCILDTLGCDKEYLTTIVNADDPNSVMDLPDSPSGTFKVSAVLRNVDHSLYFFDPTPDMPDSGDERTVIDEVDIVRE
jgi:hypothetical protein